MSALAGVTTSGTFDSPARTQSAPVLHTMAHPQRGEFKMAAAPIKLSDSPHELKAAPLLGEHTAEVLGELLDYSEAQIHALEKAGVV